MRALIRLLFGLALVLVLGACDVDVAIDLDVTEDGSGTIAVEAIFDAEASDALGGVDEALLLSDLANAGWSVTRPEVGGDGSVTIVASKAVPSADQWQPILDEIAGPGVFTDFDLTTTDEFSQHRQTLSFDIDLRDGWDLFSDADVAAQLGGEPFGVPIDQLTDGRTLDEIVSVVVDAAVTGDEDAPPSVGTFTPGFADAAPTQVRLESFQENTTAVLLRWISYALASLFALSVVLAVTGWFLQRRADRLRPPSRPSSLQSRIPGTVGAAPAGVASGAVAGPDDPVRLVVIDPLAVLYEQPESSEAYVLSFVRHNGGDARGDEILDAHDRVLRGGIDTVEFWSACGVEAGDDADAIFVSVRQLRKDAPRFLRELEKRRIPIAAIADDASSWSTAMRDRDRLHAIWPWLVSADVGVTKPDPGLFERLRRETGIAHAHCLYLDSDIEALDAARSLGMRTALLHVDGRELPDVVGHPVVTQLQNLVPKR